MKKQLLIISIIIVIGSIFISCSANSSSENISTTAVTDSQGTTHYYKSVTDENGNTVLAEIETQIDSKAVTSKNGTYVTNEHTTVLPINNEATTKPSSSAKPTTEKSSSSPTNNNADNDIEFEVPDKETTKPTTTEKQTTTTTPKDTQPATDKDGWITKWY